MKLLLRVFLGLFVLTLFYSVTATAENQKPYVDKVQGYSIALPSRWEITTYTTAN